MNLSSKKSTWGGPNLNLHHNPKNSVHFLFWMISRFKASPNWLGHSKHDKRVTSSFFQILRLLSPSFHLPPSPQNIRKMNHDKSKMWDLGREGKLNFFSNIYDYETRNPRIKQQIHNSPPTRQLNRQRVRVQYKIRLLNNNTNHQGRIRHLWKGHRWNRCLRVVAKTY